MSKLPVSIVAVDVETTGFYSSDRIVSLGACRVRAENFVNGELAVECLHIIVDPGKKSHPRAEEVHGYSDWVLRHQDPFSKHAQTVSDFIASGDIVVAHNASFDLEFIAKEYRALGQKEPGVRSYCTMNGYRSVRQGRASLNAVCAEMGLSRVGKRHGALEDAWLALMAYLWLHQVPRKHIQPFAKLADIGLPIMPANFREPPPLPDGPLPRRSRRVTENVNSYTNSPIKDALLREVRPTAILLLEIARADQSMAAEEVDILTSIVRATKERLGLDVSDEVEHQILAELFVIELSQNLLTRAARSLCENPAAREAFPRWLATMATADGGLSAAKRESVDRVKAAIRRVLPK